MASSSSLAARLRRDAGYQLRQMKKHRKHYLFMLPFTVLFVLFVLCPVAISIFFGFTSFNVLEPPTFVGLQNYFRLFLHDEIFLTAIRNTLIFAVVTGPVGYALALLFAWLINELDHTLRVIFTVVFYAPSISGGMAVIWNYLFSGDAKGLLNATLIRFGAIGDPINYLQNAAYVMPIMIVIILWMSLGTTFLSFIAGFQGIDRQYYEAGAIDGIRDRWQELWFITLPLMKPQLMFGAVMSITAAFGVGDIITQVVGFPSVDYCAHTVMNHLSDYGTVQYEMGYACAIATLLFVTMILCNKAVQALLRKVGG